MLATTRMRDNVSSRPSSFYHDALKPDDALHPCSAECLEEDHFLVRLDRIDRLIPTP